MLYDLHADLITVHIKQKPYFIEHQRQSTNVHTFTKKGGILCTPVPTSLHVRTYGLPMQKYRVMRMYDTVISININDHKHSIHINVHKLHTASQTQTHECNYEFHNNIRILFLSRY